MAGSTWAVSPGSGLSSARPACGVPSPARQAAGRSLGLVLYVCPGAPPHCPEESDGGAVVRYTIRRRETRAASADLCVWLGSLWTNTMDRIVRLSWTACLWSAASRTSAGVSPRGTLQTC